MTRLLVFLRATVACLAVLLLGARPEPVTAEPMWAEADVQPRGGPVLVYETVLSMRPPFFKGKMPLRYHEGKRMLAMDERGTVYQDFGKFRNRFVYREPANEFSGITDGARTTDSAGRLLAEARVVRFIEGEKGQPVSGIEIEEQYYDAAGKVVFTCRSVIEMGTGFKVSEKEQKGRKTEDFYFLWPAGSF